MGQRGHTREGPSGSWLDEWQVDRTREDDQLPVIVAANVAPVSTSMRSPEFSGDSMASTDVSICPFTVLAKGMFPAAGTQPPLTMPSSLQKTKKPRTRVT